MVDGLALASSIVVAAIQRVEDISMNARSLLRKIQGLLNQNWEVRAVHQYWETDSWVDILANNDYLQESTLMVYEQPPTALGQVLLCVLLGVSPPRLIPL